jgi:DNA repair protein RecO (recombination protein O)
MPRRESEAIVLRTYPLKEADKIVSFFSRSSGKMRGVAAGARKLKNRFGTALEPLSHVRLWYFQRETRELVSIDSAELIRSYFEVQSDYAAGLACAYISEVCEQVLPDHEPNEPMFRLVLLALETIRQTREIWPALTYFGLWTVRLAGLLPSMERCVACGRSLAPDAPAYFQLYPPGVYCAACGPAGAWELSAVSRQIAREMLRASLADLPPRKWGRETAADLRRLLEQRIEAHIERKLITRPALDALE